MTHTVTRTHTHAAYTHAGWVPCVIKRTKYRKIKKENDRIERVAKHFFVQLLPAMNIVKRLPTSLKEV
jgi:hypothetical protein